MQNSSPVLALIPARGGSKSLPGKNMYDVDGIPLIGYSIKAAIKSKHICDVYVTSDDVSILNYAKTYGVNLVNRPYIHSTDVATASDVVKHFISTISDEIINQNPFIAYLQPTSPLRNEKHIDEAFEQMINSGSNQLISVVRMIKTPFKAFILDKKGNLKHLFNENYTNSRRQDLPQAYMPNGAIYIFRLSDFVKNYEFPSNGSYPYLMDNYESLDIDTKDDISTLCNSLKKSKLFN